MRAVQQLKALKQEKLENEAATVVQAGVRGKKAKKEKKQKKESRR